MATCSYSDWPSTPILHTKLLSKALYSNVLSIAPSLFTYQKLTILGSSKSPSPLLDDSSNAIQFVQHFDSETGRQSDTPDRSQIRTFEDYREARKHPGFRPDSRMLNLLIASLVRTKQWESILLLSDDFRAFGVFPSKSSCSRLITDCIRARKFKMVESLLGVLQERKEIAVLAFGSAMRSYNKLHMYSSTVAAFDVMRTAGLAADGSSYLSAMDAYQKLGSADKVHELFTEFESRYRDDGSYFSPRIYWVLCDSLARSSRPFEALRYFREMIDKGLAPSPSFYASLICSFAGIKEAEIAEDLYREASEKGMAKDPAVVLKLVLMYVDLGSVEKTIPVVDAMVESGIKVSDCVLCAVVNGYATKRGLRAAVGAYERLKLSSNCTPGQVTFASVINVYCCLGLPLKAEEVFSEMMERGFDRCVVAYSNMISMYGKLGRVRDATRLLARMKEKRCEPNVWVYNSLIDIHARVADARKAEKLWKEMKRRMIAPDKISYSSIKTAYAKAREYDRCLELYREFRTVSGAQVDKVLAGIMVGVFSKSGRVDELVRLLQDLKSQGTGLDVRLYKSSLNALRDAGLRDHVKWLQANFKYEMGQDFNLS